MKIQPIFSILGTGFAVCLIILSAGNHVFADTQQTESIDSFYKSLSKKLETGLKGPISGWRYYYTDGFHIDSRKKNLNFKINGQIFADGGNIDADNELQSGFPDLDGSNILFRKLSVSVYGNIYDTADFKIEFDFVNARDIQDNWIRFLKYPHFDQIKIGHQKEPFSLGYLTSNTRNSFMERALPVNAFDLGRNIGIRYDSLRSDKRINWGAGVFLNTGSFSTLGEAGDQLTEANGFNVTARVFGLPVFEENGKKCCISAWVTATDHAIKMIQINRWYFPLVPSHA